jgi:hypothetical protein
MVVSTHSPDPHGKTGICALPQFSRVPKTFDFDH